MGIRCVPIAVAGFSLVVACGPPARTEAQLHQNDVSLTVANHTDHPICRIYAQAPLASNWIDAFHAPSEAGCIGPGASRSIRFELPDSYAETRISFEAHEKLDTRQAGIDKYDFSVPRQGPLVFEPTAQRSSEAGSPPPRTVEEIDRQEAVAAGAAQRQADKSCFAGADIPNTPAGRIHVTGKWLCSGEGFRARLLVVGEPDRLQVSEDLWQGTDSVHFDMSGQIHGQSLYAMTDPHRGTDNTFVELDAMPGGVVLQQSMVIARQCGHARLVCTRR